MLEAHTMRCTLFGFFFLAGCEAAPTPTMFTTVLGEWTRVAEATAPSGPNALRQSGEHEHPDFPRVLVWTKADSLTSFDDLEATQD